MTWHLNCDTCGMTGSGSQRAMKRVASNHLAMRRHSIRMWPRGRRDETEIFMNGRPTR